MTTYFTIGEVSKFYNISVQMLRYYDKIDVLKPVYINEKTRYRYYSKEQFIILDIIKQLRGIGLAFDEIKLLINKVECPEGMLDIINKQKDMINEQIKKLNLMENNLNYLEENIKSALAHNNEIYISKNIKRKYIKYELKYDKVDDFEKILRQVILNFEKKYGNINRQIAFGIDLNELIKENIIKYKDIRIIVDIDETNGEFKEGNYLTLVYDDFYLNSLKYYSSFFNYIGRNNISLNNDIVEIVILPRIDKYKIEKDLCKIELLID